MTMIVTEDGYQLRAFSSMYIDFGLEITRFGKELFYSPSCLSRESYGVDWNEDEPDEEGVPWTEDRWAECLRDEADELIKAFTEGA